MGRHFHLDVLEVDDPCPEDFGAMMGSGPVRFCGLCRENVYDLSEMTRAEAEELIQQAEGRICVSFYRRADGTVSTVDCAPVRFEALRRAARRSLVVASGLVAALMTFVLGLASLLVMHVAPQTGDEVARKIDRAAKLMLPVRTEPVRPIGRRAGGIRARPRPPREAEPVRTDVAF
jgi:hypothetical protein